MALHVVWHTPATLLLATLSPLLLCVGGDRRGKWAMLAVAWWLLLAAANLVCTGDGTFQRFASLLVLTFVLSRFYRVYAAMHELSRRDALTGLLNRRAFEEAASHELTRTSRYARPIAFALLDVDHFKAVNDRFGHGFGDFVLKTLASELKSLRGSDLAVRLGGDEFGILLPETDCSGAKQLLERLQQSVRERTALAGWPVTLSVGIVDLDTLQRTTPSMDVLMEEADRRMYRAKRCPSKLESAWVSG